MSDGINDDERARRNQIAEARAQRWLRSRLGEQFIRMVSRGLLAEHCDVPFMLVRDAIEQHEDELGQVFSLARDERERQDEKWGRDVERIASAAKNSSDGKPMTCEQYGLPSQDAARAFEHKHRHAGNESFVATALEELCEIVDATIADEASGGERKTKGEVLQLLAVCVKWYQAITRRENARLAQAARNFWGPNAVDPSAPLPLEQSVRSVVATTFQWTKLGEDGFSVAKAGRCELSISPAYSRKDNEWIAVLSFRPVPTQDAIELEVATFDFTTIEHAQSIAEGLPHARVNALLDTWLKQEIANAGPRYRINEPLQWVDGLPDASSNQLALYVGDHRNVQHALPLKNVVLLIHQHPDADGVWYSESFLLKPNGSLRDQFGSASSENREAAISNAVHMLSKLKSVIEAACGGYGTP